MAENEIDPNQNQSRVVWIPCVAAGLLVVIGGYVIYLGRATQPEDAPADQPREAPARRTSSGGENANARNGSGSNAGNGSSSNAGNGSRTVVFSGPSSPGTVPTPVSDNFVVGAQQYPAHILIDAAELARPEIAMHFRVLDTRSKEQYLAGHIPCALWVNHDSWTKLFAAETPRQDWVMMIGDLGIMDSTPLVICDDGRATDAADIWWILRYWNFEDVRLLNGGMYGWTVQEATTNQSDPVYKVQRIKLRPGIPRLARKDQVLEVVQKRSEQIIDARSFAEFSGEVHTAQQNGAIPTAKHFAASTVLNAKTLLFKPAQDLTKLFEEVEIDPLKPAIIYCQSGNRAALLAFTMELMGARHVCVYYRGWEEWGNAENAPVARETKPK